jgi:hypothetical protein
VTTIVRLTPRVRFTVRTMMVAVAIVAVFMACSYDWSARRDRCYDIASRHASLSAEYRPNAQGPGNIPDRRLARPYEADFRESRRPPLGANSEEFAVSAGWLLSKVRPRQSTDRLNLALVLFTVALADLCSRDETKVSSGTCPCRQPSSFAYILERNRCRKTSPHHCRNQGGRR